MKRVLVCVFVMASLSFAYLGSVELPLISAHRGGAGLAPENTVEGWRYVKTFCDPDVFELDVHLSFDDSLIIIHDATVDRTTDGLGNVKDLTYAELRELNAGFWFSYDEGLTYPWRDSGLVISTLGELFDSFPQDNFNIEIKVAEPGIEQQVADVIYAKRMAERVVVGSTHQGVLDRFRTIAPDIPTSGAEAELRPLVIWGKVLLGWMVGTRMNAAQVPEHSGSIHVVTRGFVRMCHRKGIQVHVWTVNDTESMRRLFELGADGIITDRPDLAQAVAEAMGLR